MKSQRFLLAAFISVVILLVVLGFLTYQFYSENRNLRIRAEKLEKEVLSLKKQYKELQAKVESQTSSEENKESKESKEEASKANSSTEKEKSEVVEQCCYIKDVNERMGNYFLTVDFAQLLTGEEARKEAEKRGWSTDIDYCVINDNPRLRTYPVSDVLKNGRVKLTSRSDGDVPEGYYLPFGQWFDVYKGMGDQEFCNRIKGALYWIKIKDGKVISIEQQYLP